MHGAKTTVIGLTGNIASGKSHIARIFREHGALIQSSDAAAHDVMNGAALAEIAKQFPTAIDGGKINRQALGREVFGNAEKLVKLESILHPLVRKKNIEFVKNNPGKLIVLEIPLLFEADAHEICDYTVFVHVSKETQRQRALARHGMNPEKLEKIIERQTKISVEEKMKHADFIIQNDHKDNATAQVIEILAKISI